MRKQLHNSFRSVLKVVKQSYDLNGLDIPIRLVYWASVYKQTRSSVHSNHYAVTIYVGSVKHSGVAAKMPSKPSVITHGNVQDYFDSHDTSRAFTHALYSYLGGKSYTGKVLWADRGTSMVRCDKTGMSHVLYSCNVVGADSGYPELVKNVVIKKGDKVKFVLDKDPYVSSYCGCTEAEIISKEIL